MRDFEVRVWCEVGMYYEEKFIIDEELECIRKFIKYDGNIFIINIYNDGRCFYDEMNNAKIMQYTGMKAKGGKKIYEGDIVKGYHKGIYFNESIQGVIKFGYGVFFIEEIYPNGNKNRVSMDKLSELEIKGNVYENSELLEG